jgi:hypothetical protein
MFSVRTVDGGSGGLRKGWEVADRELTDLLIADGVRDGVRPPTDAERAEVEIFVAHARARTFETDEDPMDKVAYVIGCPVCGGDCGEECGVHPAGCTYGGFSEGFWLVAEGCKFDHPTTSFNNDLIDTPEKAGAAAARFMQMHSPEPEWDEQEDERCPYCGHPHFGEVTDDGEGRWCDTPTCSEPGCCACPCTGKPEVLPVRSTRDIFHGQLEPRQTLRQRARALVWRLRPTNKVLCAMGIHGPVYRRWADDPLVSRLEAVCRTCRGVQG